MRTSSSSRCVAQMTFGKSFLLLICLGMIATLGACGGSGHVTTTPPPTISVSLSSAPTTLAVNATATITATVVNDSSNSGVTWTCAPAGTCGTFSSASTPSGTAVTYTAPATVPASPGTVVITATSVKDATKSASTPAITITAVAAITVTISTPPPASMAVSTTASIAATVTGDSANAGVTWSCAPAGSCGSFNPTQTASAASTVYTAPATVPAGGTVTITATSVTDPTKTATATVTITAAASIIVTISTPPPASMTVSTTASIAATVTGDLANAGVTWSCAPAGSCGSFNPTQTASGVTTVYTAPSTVPSGSIVTITATSVTDPTKTATATVTITATAFTGLAPGNYVFSLTGMDAAHGVYTVAGVFTVDSSGTNITGGEQVFSDSSTFNHDNLASGTVAASSSDSNLIITLTTCTKTNCASPDPSVGVAGVETLDAAMVTSTKFLLSEFDTSATSSGELDLQTSTAAPSGSYAFVVDGVASNGTSQLSISGVLDIASAGTISTTGSVFDLSHQSGVVLPDETFSSGTVTTVTTPVNFGFVTFALTPTDTTIPEFALSGYIIDANHIKLVESTDILGGTTGGSALGQGANTGTFSSSSVSGLSYVFEATGQDATAGTPAVQVAGVLTFSSAGTVSGQLNFNDVVAQSPQGGSAITGGTYTVDPTGRVTVTGITDAGPTFSYNLQFYLTGDGHATVSALDTSDVLGGYAWQQAASLSASSFNGSYAADFSQVLAAGGERDGVGTVSADGVSSFTGFLDVNKTFVPVSDLSVSGTFATGTANGVLTGTITDPVSATANSFTYYVIDTTHVLAIEDDNVQLTLGTFENQ